MACPRFLALAVRPGKGSNPRTNTQPPLTGQECYQGPYTLPWFEEGKISDLKMLPQQLFAASLLTACPNPPHWVLSAQARWCYLDRSPSVFFLFHHGWLEQHQGKLSLRQSVKKKKKAGVIKTDRLARTLNVVSNEKC